MKAFYMICFWLGLGQSIWAQSSLPTAIRAQTTMEVLSRGGVSSNYISYGLPIEPGTLLGDAYLNRFWNKASFLTYKDEKLVEGYFVKINLQDNQLEIKLKNGFRGVYTDQIKSLVWIDSLTQASHYFVNGAEYKTSEKPVAGLLEVLVDGQYALMKHTYAFVRKATYNVALDMGSKDAKIIQKTEFYWAQGSTLRPIKKKEMNKHFPALEDFINKKDLSLNKESDLISIFTELNKPQ
jgi:hypothetical protein